MTGDHAHHMMLAATAASPGGLHAGWWLTIGLHTLGYLLVTAGLALLAYHKLGVAFLRRAWFNLEYLWIGALFAMGILTLFL
jgi:hypothetical protein